MKNAEFIEAMWTNSYMSMKM